MKNTLSFKTILFKEKGWVLTLSLLVLAIPGGVSLANGASIQQISETKANYQVGETIVLKVVRGDNLPATGTIAVSLQSNMGAEFSTANLSGTCTGVFGVGPSNANIIGNNSQKAFCYRNFNNGFDTITAFFTQGSSSEQATFDVTIVKEDDVSDCLNLPAKLIATAGSGDDCDKGTSTPNTGILSIHKVVVGDLDPDYTQFSFLINDSATTSFADNGKVQLLKEIGEYTVTEVPILGYDVSYENCVGVRVTSEATTTCIITNTKKEEITPKPDTYNIGGYVWRDNNENAIWDEFGEGSTELPLIDWTVKITNGSTTLSTTTDEFGYYYFVVEAGTWVITENLPTGWKLTTVDSYTVTVPEEQLAVNVFQSFWSYLLPTVYAESKLSASNNYNFGNVEIPPVVITTNRGGSSSSGGRRRVVKERSAQEATPVVAPKPQVLGEQITIVPVGAPNTGAGGASPALPTMTLGHLLYVCSEKFLLKSK